MKWTLSRITRTFTLAAIALLLFGTAASVTTQQPGGPGAAAIYRGASTAIQFDTSPPLSELARSQPTVAGGVEDERFDDPPSGLEGPLGPQGIDPLVQQVAALDQQEMPAAAQSFDGMSQTSGPSPPDTVGDVGPNHYVQMVNSRYAVYSKTGTLLAGPANINTLWSGFGGPCQTENAGDPIVLYDQIADRWLLTQFTAAGPTYFNCVALSTGPDPAGTYYRWAFSTGTNFPDYPKYGIWSDGYYISTREFLNTGPFAGVGAYVLNKTQMLAGNAAPQIISFLAPPSPSHSVGDGLLPTDLDGTTLPPEGTPNFFIGSRDNGGPYGAPSDALNIWKFTTDFTTPANSSFVLANTVAVTEFDSMLSACSGRNCVPQPGTAQKLDHQGYRQRVLHRAAYRNFGTHQSIVTNQSVEVPTAMSGMRWWEIRSPNSSPTIHQEGTYAPGASDGVHRWFGSIAQDQSGNMALGYSASAATATFPGVRYTGRLVGETLGTMPQAEVTLVAGGGSQTSSGARWGDYSSMNVDPVDDCTFWYTTEYYATTSVSGWRTRIGSFKFPSCSSVPTPAIVANGSSITDENFVPANQAIDPGERPTVSFTVINGGSGATSNLVATLLNTGGVTGASAAQTYGAIASGASVSRSFSFTASGTCGGTLTATLQLQDGATDLGNITYTFTLGVLVATTTFSETFDGVTAPALPAGWTTAATGAESPWVTSTTSPFGGANAAFAPDPATTGHTELVTPAISVSSSATQVSFKNNYITESCCDGMVLEISINGGAFADITTGGNTFISGGYNSTLFSGSSLGGRQAWSGNSGGYITSSINLPAGALGQSVRLKWRMASDSSVAGTGVRIDSIAITTSSSVCSSASVPTVVTLAASNITTTGATLNGTVNPNGSSTTALFEYGFTTSYGLQATASPVPGSGTSPVAVSAAIAGLTCSTPYHFRAAATNTAGTGLGTDESFATAACPAFTDTPLVAQVTAIKAVHITELRSRVNALRLRFGLLVVEWTDSDLQPGVIVQGVHVSQLRAGLIAAYNAAKQTPPSFTDDPLVLQQTAIGKIHIDQLRAAVVTLEAVP